MLQSLLISHGSPTLAKLKVASLWRVPLYKHFEQEFEEISGILLPKGLRLVILQRSEDSVLLYMYREQMLKDILSRPDIRCFLSQYSYEDYSVEAALGFLSKKINCRSDNGFPHEIGVFLGYPLEDVIAFILNEGKNCKCTGCWKAYTDQCGAMKTFALYAKCKEVYTRLFAAGIPIKRLAVRS